MLKKTWFLWLCGLLLFAVSCNSSSDSGGSAAALSGVSNGKTTASVTGSDVVLEWDSGVKTITRISAEEEETVMVAGNSYAFKELSEGSSHIFVLTSETGEQNIAYAYVGEKSQPGVISAIAHNERAEIIWEAVEGVAGYELYMSTSENSGYTRVGGLLSASSVMVENLSNNTTYYFRVQAVYADSGRNISSISPMTVIPGYTFGEVTAVTPGDQERHIRVFKGFLKDEKLSFMWDAVPMAVTYNFYGSDAAYGTYELIANIPANNYVVELPSVYGYFRVAPVIDGIREGEKSQFIELTDYEVLNWSLGGGIESVTVTFDNYTDFHQVTLACMGAGESDWLTTMLTASPFTAGWLEPMDYDCKLILTYADGFERQTLIKRATVYPYPDPDQLISVYVKNNTANLIWHVMNENDSYDVLLSKDGSTTLEVVATDLRPQGDLDMRYSITGLQCGVDYAVYIKTNQDNEVILSVPAEFIVDTDYCAGLIEVGGFIQKLEPAGDIPGISYYHRATVLDDKLYVFGGRLSSTSFIWVYDPAEGSQGNWTRLEPEGNMPTIRRDVHLLEAVNGKIYTFSGATGLSDTWVYDPQENKWTELHPEDNPSHRRVEGSLVYDGKIYLFGGGPVGDNATQDIWVFDPEDSSEGSWTQIKDGYEMPGSMTKPVLINGEIYIIGGSQETVGGGGLGQVWKYDPLTQNLIRLNSTPSGSRLMTHQDAAVYDGKAYVWTGSREEGQSFYRFDPEMSPEGGWQKVTPEGEIPGKRWGASFNEINGKIYLFGGEYFLLDENGEIVKNEEGINQYTGNNDLYVYTPES